MIFEEILDDSPDLLISNSDESTGFINGGSDEILNWPLSEPSPTSLNKASTSPLTPPSIVGSKCPQLPGQIRTRKGVFYKIKSSMWHAISPKKPGMQTLKRGIGGGSKADIDAVFFELKSSERGQLETGTLKPSAIQRHSLLAVDSSPKSPAEGSKTFSTVIWAFPAMAGSKKIQKVPRLELVREKEWIVEYYKNTKAPLKIEGATISQNLQVRECDGATVIVSNKLNNVIIESCKRTNVILEGVISSVELVHCDKVKLQVLGSCPSVNLDNCSGFTMFVNKEGKEVVVSTSRSCDMNINFPKSTDDDEWVEVPIPQLFCHQITDNDRITSRVSDLYR